MWIENESGIKSGEKKSIKRTILVKYFIINK